MHVRGASPICVPWLFKGCPAGAAVSGLIALARGAGVPGLRDTGLCQWPGSWRRTKAVLVVLVRLALVCPGPPTTLVVDLHLW